MFIDFLAENAQLFLLIFARIMALVSIAPLISSGSIPIIARIGLALFAAVAIFPSVVESGYPLPDTGLQYAAILIGEILIGLTMGFILVVIYAAFLVAGQFFSLQMGFAASQVFDPLSQIQIPIMGQFFNIIAMYIFVIVGGFQKIFLVGVLRSFDGVRPMDFAVQRDYVFRLFLHILAELFEQALIISFPILGTLFLVSITMGLLAKAAPQMNLLMMGFPVAIGVAFLLILLILPFLVQALERIIEGSFQLVLEMIGALREASP